MKAPIPPRSRYPRKTTMAALLAASLLMLLVAACGGGDSTPEIVVVTATYTPQPVVVVVTATYTATPEGGGSDVQPSPTFTPTEQPSEPEEVVAEEPTATLQPTLEATSLPATKIAAPQEPVSPPTPKPTAVPQASLSSYRVVYSNFDGGDQYDEFKYSVWMMRGDGQQAGELLRPGIEPSFSADGRRIAYYRPFNGIWVYDLDAKSNTHVVAADYAEFPSFSPDGQRLVHHELNEDWWTGDFRLFIVNADGSGRTQLSIQGRVPAWSPKGGLIAFHTCQGNDCGIFVIQPNEQGLRQVTSDTGSLPAWSPDGKKLAYSTEADGDLEVFVINLDGSGKKQLTQNTGNDTLPVFSPDGKYIYFLSDQNGTAWAIRAMRSDGTDVKTIRQIGVPPRWRFSRLWVTWW